MKARMIVNPMAGIRLTRPDMQQAARVLREAGWQLDVVTTQRCGHGTELARDAVGAGCQVVIACGGDGTVNEVLQSLVGTEVALAVIPAGTVNVFAREFGLPRDPVAAAQALLAEEIHLLDVGQANGRYFLLWVGIGFDAEVVRRAKASLGAGLWVLPYIPAAIGAFLASSGVDTRVEFDGESVRAKVLMAVISNVRKYAFFDMAPSARADDGVLDLCVFAGAGAAAKLRHLARFLLGRHLQAPEVYYRRVGQASFEPATPLPVQVDGEFAGTTPVVCRVVPRSLKVVLPPSRRRERS